MTSGRHFTLSRDEVGNQGKKIWGTREWAVANIDCCTGCPHGCRYCYARYDAVVRRGTVAAEEWQRCCVRQEDVTRQWPHYDGQVMFPCTHDIVPENLDSCLQVIENLLAAGNSILIVTKPHLACIEPLCEQLKKHKESILFRFTITADTPAILSFWEPHAPGYEERRSCLQLAAEQGFATSVSIEPMLNTETVVQMVADLAPWVSHSLWLGKMNKIEERVEIDSPEMQREIERIKRGQSDEKIYKIYNQLRDNPLVFWKESIKEVVGLQLATQPGEDR